MRGIAIGWTGINVQQYVTATTFLILTNLNKIIVVACGMIFMGDAHGPVAILGIVMALSGGLWYTLARENIEKKQKEAKKSVERAVQLKKLAMADDLEEEAEPQGHERAKGARVLGAKGKLKGKLGAMTAKKKSGGKFTRLEEEDKEGIV